jgi:hypothetical protein
MFALKRYRQGRGRNFVVENCGSAALGVP